MCKACAPDPAQRFAGPLALRKALEALPQAQPAPLAIDPPGGRPDPLNDTIGTPSPDWHWRNGQLVQDPPADGADPEATFDPHPSPAPAPLVDETVRVETAQPAAPADGRTVRLMPADVPPAPAPAPEPAPAPVEEKPAVKETPAPAPAAVAERPAELRENIFFRIGSSQIRTTEEAKVGALVEYLKANPSARIEIVGYADAATGSHALNLKLSRQRAAGVAAALEQAGIAADRISAEGRGDTVQPFPGVAQDRVSNCIAQ